MVQPRYREGDLLYNKFMARHHNLKEKGVEGVTERREVPKRCFKSFKLDTCSHHNSLQTSTVLLLSKQVIKGEGSSIQF